MSFEELKENALRERILDIVSHYENKEQALNEVLENLSNSNLINDNINIIYECLGKCGYSSDEIARGLIFVQDDKHSENYSFFKNDNITGREEM